jgi:hypothetical protein
MVVDEFHGIGGSYILDPKTGKRTQVEKPTAPSPEGGARDKDGALLNKASDALEPAFAPPAADPVQVDPAPPSRTAKAAPAAKGD